MPVRVSSSSPNARPKQSIWSSCRPFGNMRISAISASVSHVPSSNTITLPMLTCAANGPARVTLSPDSAGGYGKTRQLAGQV